MPSFAVTTVAHRYEAIVERGALARLPEFLPERSGRLFTVTTRDVWELHGQAFTSALAGREFQTLFFPGGEEHKRLAAVEALAEEMVALGADRSSVVIGFGGGIVTDLAGFLAAIFMRGVPFVSVPTTLLAQVDAGVGGKTGANLKSGKNLIGAFHQPLVALADPSLLATLPEREYRAGLFEVLKCGVIRSQPLFRLLADDPAPVRRRDAAVVERMIAESVRIKCEVVSTDEKEHGLRRILNFGHTVGHAIEAETGYTRYLHGEAVGLGMKAAAWLSHLAGRCSADVAEQIVDSVDLYGPLPASADLHVERLLARLAKDKKTLRGAVHFVLATAIGSTEVVAGLEDSLVLEALRKALQ
ncbi:MAG: 3-dehydroquinate synthase [Bryobacteraceae bacterium]